MSRIPRSLLPSQLDDTTLGLLIDLMVSQLSTLPYACQATQVIDLRSVHTNTSPLAGFQPITADLVDRYPELAFATEQNPELHIQQYIRIIHSTIPYALAVNGRGNNPTRIDLYAQPQLGRPNDWPRTFEEALCPATPDRDPLLPWLLVLDDLGVKADFERY
ncbi:hypothetical protein EDB83DRAFT_2315874 [Lactarius deliciosus]|nr:hypothetical protein EDB83DRAFT_2315874 [Lactarius deliciosus]